MMQPFFIVGFQRSGTTLLRLMLDNHPDIAIPLDTVGLWSRYQDRLATYNNLETETDARRLVLDLLKEERIRLWEVPLSADRIMELGGGTRFADVINGFGLAYAEARGKRFWGDKDPGNMTRIDQLNAWFPQCRIIHIVRDGRDACLSHLQQDFGHKDVLACALEWREEVQWVRRMGRLLGSTRYHELRYEDLIADPAAELQKACAFLEIEYAPVMLEYHTRVDRSIPDDKRHIWKLIDQPPRKDNAGRWKRDMSPGMRICFEKRAGPALRDMGYEVLPQPLGGAYLDELRNFGALAWRALRDRLRPPKGRTG